MPNHSIFGAYGVPPHRAARRPGVGPSDRLATALALAEATGLDLYRRLAKPGDACPQKD